MTPPIVANSTSTATNPSEAAFRSLIRAFGLLKRVMEPYFAKFGISGAQWGLLRTLQRAHEAGEAGLRLTELSHRLLIRPPSVTGAIDRLERMGLVTRTAARDDQRARLVSLTASGRKLVARALEGHGQRIQQILSSLAPSQQQQLHLLLESLCSHLEENQASGATTEERDDEDHG